MRKFRSLGMAALLFVVATSRAPAAALWTCHGAKPGHPTAEERERFVREVTPLAVQAERRHGVPAAALAAIAIAESSYGWTRAALEANNLFAWKAGPVSAEAGKAYRPACERRSRGHGFLVFGSRAEGFDFVASRLAVLDGYREHTEAYRAARKRGDDSRAPVDAWVAGIAARYSRQPERFTSKMKRIMNDPLDAGDRMSAENALYHLSAKARGSR